MTTRKQSKADKIRAYLKTNPHAGSTQIAKAVGVSQGYAHKIAQEESMKRKVAKTVNDHVTETTRQVRKKKPNIFKRIWNRIRALFEKLFRLTGGGPSSNSSPEPEGGAPRREGGYAPRNMEEEQNVNLK